MPPPTTNPGSYATSTTAAVPDWSMPPSKGFIHSGSTAARILEILDGDGWQTTAYLIDRVGASTPTVRRALHRLHDAGAVRSRPREQLKQDYKAGWKYWTENEWHTNPRP